ncbi:MAG: fused MFS/spermidine synthase, partial [Pirellulales bacterium]|nr:fused MFS/spermidine synthase [Pirellulales bacterium]
MHSTDHLRETHHAFDDRLRQRRAIRGSLLLILCCFFLSGFAALLYEVVWLRQFAIIFGTSEFALAVVLSAYLAGLSLGASVAGRFVHRVKRPVLTYAILELVIAGTAVAVPFALQFARVVLVDIFGGQTEPTDAGGVFQILFIITSTFIIIMIPTGAMGATLPLLTRHAVRNESEVGDRVGLLYTINTLGAVVGILCAAFLLLPAWGMYATMLAGVVVNFVVFLLAVLAVRILPEAAQKNLDGEEEAQFGGTFATEETMPAGSMPEVAVRPFLGQLVLPLIFFSGAVSFAWEIIWTRLLSHVLGGSIFAFATMLSSFLLGILIGSAIASRWAKTRRQAADGLAICQLGIAVSSLAVFHQIGLLAEWGRSLGISENASLWTNASLCIAVLLPSTLFIGATFPFAVRLHTETYRLAASATARIYSWNTAGAITGSLLTGLVLLPLYGFSTTAAIAVSVSLLLAVTLVLLRLKTSVGLLSFVFSGVLLAIFFPPQRPDGILRMSPFVHRDHEGDPLYVAVGRSATVHLSEGNGLFFLRTNGLPEATIPARGAIARMATEEMLSLLPVLARPQSKSMLIIGLGGALAVNAVPPSIDEVDVFELEPKVVEANRQIAKLRDRNFLSDPRVDIICNDARGGLALTTKQYDCIVSQPSHPWTAGASHLYTREFMKEVRSHLTDDGVFVQWIDINFVSQPLLKSLGATLLDVFPYVRLYRPADNALVFLASNAPIALESSLAQGDHSMSDFYNRRGLHDVHDLAAMLTFTTEQLASYCENAPLNTDDSNLLATHSLRLMLPGEKKRLDDSLTQGDALLDSGGMRAELNLDLDYLGQLLQSNNQMTRAKALVASIEDETERKLVQARIQLVQKELRDCATSVQSILVQEPENQAALEIEAMRAIAERRPIGNGMIEKLAGPGRAVAEAWNEAINQDWQAVAELDSRLSRATPKDICFTNALFLRVGWRNQSGISQNGAEAIDLLQKYVPYSEQTRFLLPWAYAGLLADEYAVVLGAVEKRIRIA